MKNHRKRCVVDSDLHVGSAVGLRLHPENKTQEQLLHARRETLKIVGKHPDVLIINGDAPEGQDWKGLSVDEPDIPWQVEEAEALILEWEPKEVYIVEGTAYHTGDTVQFERFLAGYIRRRGIKCEFVTKFRAKINGWFRVQARHKVGRSVVPWGIHTPPSRSQTNQVINAAIEARHNHEPVDWPHLSIFSHVHYWSYSETAQGAVCTTPCWKAIGDRYGDTQCDGHVDVGTFWFDVGEKEGDWSWGKRLYPARMESRSISI